MIKLYDFELSADCYKLRLLMAILRVPYQAVLVDVFPGREHESEWFRRLSPEGRLPVLDDDGFVVVGGNEGLIYLAGKFDEADAWLPPASGTAHYELLSWLAVARELGDAAGMARLAVNFGYDLDLPEAQRAAHAELRRFDEHLWFGERAGRDWLCAAAHPSIADIACFPDIALSEEGGISRQDYPAVRRWMDRVKRVPGFTTMSGVFPTAPAKV